MESSSSIHTREEQQRLLTPHEYTGKSFSLRYQDCISCGRRTEFTCVKCGYCYSCHWKREQVEKIELRDNLKDFYALSSKASNKDNEKQMIQQDATKDSGQRFEGWGTLDVLGQPADQYALTIDVITSFRFMVQESAGVGIQQMRRWGYK